MGNTSYIDTANTLPDIIEGINTATGGYLSGFLLFALFLILLVSFKGRTETKTAMTTAGTITSLFAVFFWWMGYIGIGVVFIPLAVVFAGLVMHAWD